MPSQEPTVANLGQRLKSLVTSPLRWAIGCILAGLAVVVTSATTGAGQKAFAAVEVGYCALTINKRPDADRFRIVIAKLANDPGGKLQERVAAELIPTSFSVSRGCVQGPSVFEKSGGAFDDRARRQATESLRRLSADVLVFGRVDGDKVALRFADRNGYCSDVAKIVPLSDLDHQKTRSALARAVADATVKTLVSDCEQKKLHALTEQQLMMFERKLVLLTSTFGASAEPDVKSNLWVYRTWIRAQLVTLHGGSAAVEEHVDQIVNAAPDSFSKATTLWALHTFANRNDLPALRQRIQDEAYVATKHWPPKSAAWVSMAMLAHKRLELEHPGDLNWRLSHYDALTDRVGGQDDSYVPMPDSEVNRAYYYFGRAVIEAPKPADRQVENAVQVLTTILEKKLDGQPVPITTNSLRFALAEALLLSARRQNAPSRIVRAEKWLRHIEEHPDDSTELTLDVLVHLRSKLAAECKRQRCSVDFV